MSVRAARGVSQQPRRAITSAQIYGKWDRGRPGITSAQVAAAFPEAFSAHPNHLVTGRLGQARNGATCTPRPSRVIWFIKGQVGRELCL